MSVRFSTVNNGARDHGRPFIRANVDGIDVRFSVPQGWRCSACSSDDGAFMCHHCLVVFDALSRRIQDRINHLIDIEAIPVP